MTNISRCTTHATFHSLCHARCLRSRYFSLLIYTVHGAFHVTVTQDSVIFTRNPPHTHFNILRQNTYRLQGKQKTCSGLTKTVCFSLYPKKHTFPFPKKHTFRHYTHLQIDKSIYKTSLQSSLWQKQCRVRVSTLTKTCLKTACRRRGQIERNKTSEKRETQ